MFQVQVHKSAFKRGLSVDEVIQMWTTGTEESLIDDNESPRYVRLGNGERYLVIHAMPARKSVIARMQRRIR